MSKTTQQCSRRRAILKIFSCTIMAALGVMTLQGCGPDLEDMEMGEMPPVPVSLLEVQQADVNEYREFPGRVRGVREVEVWARVQGILEERLYEEGQLVETGDALFRIERAPFAIAVQSAEADRATARAALRQAEREWRRTLDLFEQDAVSARERDSALGAFELAEAQVQSAEARVAQAKLDLGYTDVFAPVSGVTSLEAVPEGSLVGPGTKLASIIQLDPVHVYFSMPERDALIRRATEAEAAHEDLSARLELPDGSAYARDGAIDFTASQVDGDTGAVSIRAVYENPDNVLVPGQFVRVRLLLRRFSQVVVLPEEVVSEGREGPQVYLPSDDGKTAIARPIQLGPVTAEGQIVLDGIALGDRVIRTGHARLWEGAAIEIREDLEEQP